MRLDVVDGDLFGAFRHAYVGELIARNRLKRKLIAQMRGGYAKRFTASDGTVCLEALYIKTDNGTFNDELCTLLNIDKSGDIANDKVHPVWIWFAPKAGVDELGASEYASIDARVRQLVQSYSIDRITVHFERTWSGADMDPKWWRLDFEISDIPSEERDEVRLIGEIMYQMHKVYKGGNCEAWESDDYLGEYCTAATYTVTMTEDQIAKAVRSSIDIMNSDDWIGNYSGIYTNDLKYVPPLTPGLELAYHILYGTDGTIFYKNTAGYGELGVSIDALEQMLSKDFISFFENHIQTDYYYHKSTWEKVKAFLLALLIIVAIAFGLWQVAKALEGAFIAYEASMAAGASFLASVWAGVEVFVLLMAGPSAAETFGSDWVAGTYAVGAMTTYSSINQIAAIGASPEYAVPATTPQEAEQAVEIFYSQTEYMAMMMPDRQIEALMNQFDLEVA
ncbi:hypothetical protein [Hydrogenimonas sp.]